MDRAIGMQGVPLSSLINGELFAHVDESAQRRVAGRWQITDSVASPFEAAGIEEVSIEEAGEDVVYITLYNEAAFRE